ncbi:MAG: hypothetical protein SGBAC_000643 [Bacillariaceae sp.]
MASNSAADVEDAMQRLVRAMKGQTDDASVSLARRVVSSQIGLSQDRKAMNVTNAWRRVSRKAPYQRHTPELERVYSELQGHCRSGDEDLPAKVITVLTKLMGKHVKCATPEQLTSSSVAAEPEVAHSAPTPQAQPSYPQPNELSTPMSTISQPQQLYQKPEPRQPHQTMQYQSRSSVTTDALRQRQQHEHDRRPSSTSTTLSSVSLFPNTTPSQGPSERSEARAQEIQHNKMGLEHEEAALLRECLYSLQDIDGERIKYHYNSSDALSKDVSDYEGIRVLSPALHNPLLYTGQSLETRLGSGAADALRISGEAGWLYHRTQSYIHQVQQDDSKGILARAFAGTLLEELQEYHSFLASLEAKLNDVSLRQLMVELRKPTHRLKILAMLTDGLGDLSGGHLLSAIYKHTLHGDTRHASLVKGILGQVSKPWFDVLFRWTTQGVLSDPHGEFFVQEIPNVQDKFLWTQRYEINADLVPTGILDKHLVEPALNVGKGINFIRRCLLDGTWTMKLPSMDSVELGYSCKQSSRKGASSNAELAKTLKRAGELVHSHILQTLKWESHMMEHLLALKQFLFLGQGDFFSALVDGLFTEFHGHEGVVGIYKHSLLSIVEGALRSTNAKYLPQFCLDRLQVELLLGRDEDTQFMFGAGPSPSPSQQRDERSVWDIFMLDYMVPDTLIAIVDPAALKKYKKVFRFLFNLKKVEYMLNYTWRQNATLQHALQTTAQYQGINVAADVGYLQSTYLLRKISILRQSMMHLIGNLKSYLMFEVLEGGWQKLLSDIDKAKTLDEVIEAHSSYLNGIVRKSLLKGDSNELSSQQNLAEQVDTLLYIANEFCTIQEALFRESLQLADIATEKRLRAETRLRHGNWGFNTQQESAEDDNFFGLANTPMMAEVERISDEYDQNAVELLKVLGTIVNGNPDDYVDENKNKSNVADVTRVGGSATSVFDSDLDPQRSLVAQLDHNQYYSKQAV